MTFSISVSSTYDRWGGVEPMSQAAQMAEELGYFGIQLGEHIVRPLEPGARPGGLIWYDVFVLASHLATLTKRIRLLFSVVVLPYRHPIQTAKLTSTLDEISGGRVILGVGSGWLRGEFDALGLAYQERGAMTDEYIKAMKELWTQESPSFSGRYVSFSNIAFLPKCVQQPHVRLWIGGAGRRSMRRAAELGDGWCPNVGGLDSLTEDIAWTKERASTLGRRPETLDFSYRLHVGEQDDRMEAVRRNAHAGKYIPQQEVTEPQEIIDFIGRYQDIGINHLLIQFNWEKPVDFMRRMEWFAAHVIPAFAEPTKARSA